jgi:glycosyltransferase involved in cell wall biosynthesis
MVKAHQEGSECAWTRVPITLISLARNYGEHNAVMAGLRQASGARVIIMDDDLQNPPEEVERLLAFTQCSGNDAANTPLGFDSSCEKKAAASPPN